MLKIGRQAPGLKPEELKTDLIAAEENSFINDIYFHLTGTTRTEENKERVTLEADPNKPGHALLSFLVFLDCVLVGKSVTVIHCDAENFMKNTFTLTSVFTPTVRGPEMLMAFTKTEQQFKGPDFSDVKKSLDEKTNPGNELDKPI